ncbi:DUF998 domain-containing protein [Actinomyces sp. 432]|uniref:DUF998 domain-containing protein n=1 Tax=Actinomyces sp. 432 TaxID=2057798 RepID=UPI001374346B|nr:DUF998 domain-containing protein [Actinomyces sp. 432]QHO90875.1 DUF998 domain-containing protein [Actinomyces sp. 432]
MTARRARVVLALLAVVTYNSWLAWRLNGDPRALFGYLSELAAQDQPYQWFFRLGDLTAATVFAVIAVLGRRGWSRWLGVRAQHASVALGLVAAGTALDSLFNLPCAESRDAVCAAMPSQARHLHEAASVLVSVALVTLIALVALGMAERNGRTARFWAVVAFGVVIAALLLFTAVAPRLAPGTQGPVQAVQVLACAAWMALLAWRLEDEREGQSAR